MRAQRECAKGTYRTIALTFQTRVELSNYLLLWLNEIYKQAYKLQSKRMRLY